MAHMIYQCVYCKATYNHDQSYKHNAYDCPKLKGKSMKYALAMVLTVCLVGLTGCEALKNLLPQDKFPTNVDRVELVLHQGDRAYRYQCSINTETKALTDCREVQ